MAVDISLNLFVSLLVTLISVIVAWKIKDKRRRVLVFLFGTGLAGLLLFGLNLWEGDRSDQYLCPNISRVVANPRIIPVGGKSSISVIANDPSGDAITYIWEALKGIVPGEETDQQTIVYIAPDVTGLDTIKVTARNSRCSTTGMVEVQIVMDGSLPAP